MGIDGFVPHFLTHLAPSALTSRGATKVTVSANGARRTTPVACKRPNSDIVFFEIFPLLYSLPPGKALREREMKRAALDNLSTPDEHPRLAFNNDSRLDLADCGTHTMLEICQAVDARCKSHIESAGPGSIKFLTIVGDTRGDLDLKKDTRVARRMKWLTKMRMDDPRPGPSDRPVSDYIYPHGCILLNDGIRLPDGRVVLIDVERIMHSDNDLVDNFIQFIQEYLVSDGVACSSQYAVAIIDINFHLPLVVSMGSQVPEAMLPLVSESVQADLRARRASDPSAICLMEVDRKEVGLSDVCEGDMALVQHIRVQTETLAKSPLLQGRRMKLMLDTVDTDPLGVLLSLGESHPLFRANDVVWYSTKSGIWDANAIVRKLHQKGLDNPLLLTMYHLTGTDFFDKKVGRVVLPRTPRSAMTELANPVIFFLSVQNLTHKIGALSLWDAWSKCSKDQVRDVHPGGPMAVDFLVRVACAHHVGLKGSGGAPSWQEISRQNKKFPVVGPSKILLHAEKIALAQNYWATQGRETKVIPPQCAEDIHIYRTAHGSTLNVHNRSTLNNKYVDDADVDEEDEKMP